MTPRTSQIRGPRFGRKLVANLALLVNALKTDRREGPQCIIAWYVQNRELWSRQQFLRQISIVTALGNIAYH
jgi:hypothetical protein